MHAPMSFFDTTPLGRIVARFSKDQDTLDKKLPESFNALVACLLDVTFTLHTGCNPHAPSLQPHPPSLQPHAPSLQPHPPSLRPHPPSLQPHPPSLRPQDAAFALAASRVRRMPCA